MPLLPTAKTKKRFANFQWRKKVTRTIMVMGVTVIFLLPQGWLSNYFQETCHRFTYYFLMPFHKVADKVDGWYNYWSSVNNLYAENILLKTELANLKRYYSRAEIMHSENYKLKELLHFKNNMDFTSITSYIFAIQPGSHSKNATVPVGFEDGVRKKHIVTNSYGIIGTISKAYNKFSNIKLINDPNQRIAVISSSTREKAILVGNATNYMDILYLPENSQLQNGELFISSGDGKDFPYGLPVARIIRNSKNEIAAKHFLDPKTEEFVNIIKYNK